MSDNPSSDSSARCSLRKSQADLILPSDSNAAIRWKEQGNIGIRPPSFSAGQDSLQPGASSELKSRSEGSRGSSEGKRSTAASEHCPSVLWSSQHDKDGERRSPSSLTCPGQNQVDAFSTVVSPAYSASPTSPSGRAGLLSPLLYVVLVHDRLISQQASYRRLLRW